MFVLKRTLAVSILLAAIALLAGWWSYTLTLRNAIDRLYGEATLLAEHAGRSLEAVDMTLKTLVERIEAEWRDGRPPDARHHEALRRKVGEMPQVTGMQVIGADGRLLADQLDSGREGSDLSGRAYVRAHREGSPPRQIFIGDPVRGRITGKAFATASYALLAPDGRFGGVVAATFDPFYYRRFYRRQNPPGRQHDVALVDEEGIILASSADFASTVGVPSDGPTAAGGFRPAATPGGYLRFALPSSGAVYIAYLVRVPTVAFYAFVGLPEREALDNWRSLAFGLAAAWLLGTLGFAAAFTAIWRRETQRRAAFAAEEKAHLEARRALANAEAANAAKSRFLAHISHELRTPLNAILGFSEVIRDRMIGGDARRDSEYAALIHKSGSHLLQIINDLLDLSRIEAGKMPIRPERLDVAELLKNAGFLASRDLTDRKVEMTTEVPAGCPPLFADQRAAKQMLVNLLSNAVKFSPRGGTVRVSAVPCGDGGIDITVRDQGSGIPAEKLHSLYEPFGLAGGEITGYGQGTGLGLPLVKSLIELHGGSIAVTSTEGEGTVVTLAFPAAPPCRGAAPATVPAAQVRRAGE